MNMIRKFLLYSMLLGSVLISMDLRADTNLKKGDQYYQVFDFTNAIKSYEAALKGDPENTSIKEKIANSYRLMNNTIEMERWFGEVVKDPNAAPINSFYLAQALRANEKYDEALLHYNNFNMKVKDARPLQIINGYKYIQKLAKGSSSFKVENLREANSAESEFSPMFYRDTAIIFVSNAKRKGARIDFWTQMPFLDLYIVSRDKGKINNPRQFASASINGQYHEGPLAFSNEYGSMFITRSNYKGKSAKVGDDKRTVNLKIYKVNYEGDIDNWKTAEEGVPFNSDNYSVAHPAFSPNDDYMYFASDMPGGFGGTDLYVVRKDGNTWGRPENLGPEINTPGEEKFPFVGADGTLYFASDGQYGLGGLDIYKVKKDSKTGTWSKAENLGAPFNCSQDDFGFIIAKDNQSGYLSSNRPGGFGSDDIYRWSNNALKLNIRVKDGNSLETLAGTECKLICAEEFKGGKKTNEAGEASYVVIPETRCTLKIAREGYKPKVLAVNIGSQSKDIEVKLAKEASPEMKLEILVLDKSTNQPIPGAIINIISKSTPEKVKSSTDKNGKLMMAGIVSNNEYYISVEKETGEQDRRYLTVKQNLNTIGKQGPAYLKEVIYLELVEKNVAIKIDNIYYDLNQHYIREDAAKELDKLVKVLLDNPTIEIELSSHTDCRSSYQYNMNLSAKRAEAAVKYISSKGVAARRMISAGYGESKLMNNCACEGNLKSSCSDAEHQLNRRTEFKILKF